MVVCPLCGRENPAHSRSCLFCATPFAAPAPREVRKSVTVLFADVIESTALGDRLDPEAVRRVMSRYFESMQAVVERHGGRVEKFIGDAIMAVFGVPVAHEDDALRALRAAAEMRASLEELNHDLERDQGVQLEMRVGVNTGEVVASHEAAEQRLVTGDAVNVAARLEQAAAPGQILMGGETRQLVGGAVEATGPEQIVVKGKPDPIEVFALVSVVQGASGPPRRLDGPLVGRDREYGALRAAFEQAIEEHACRLCTVLGTAGVGKSRLAGEFVAWAGSRATVLIGHCLPYGEGITYWPMIEALQRADELLPLDRPGDVAGEDDLSIRTATEQVERLIAGREAPGSREELFWALRVTLQSMASQRPLVLIIEDLHWAEPTLLDFVEYVADWWRGAPLLILCLARPELLEERPSWSRRLHEGDGMVLQPLSDEAADSLIDTIVGDASLAPATRTRIAEAAQGNPLFLEQMLAVIAEEDGATAEVSVPPTIWALLNARLDRLTYGERVVIDRAAVIGRVFSWEAVRELSPEAEHLRVDEQLMTLVRKELLSPEREAARGQHLFRFRHALIRDAAYAAMSKETRAELHERLAALLERESDEHDEIVGYHLEQAFHYQTELGRGDERWQRLGLDAAVRLDAAGRRAFGAGDMPAASNLIERATLLYPDGRRERLQLLPTLGKVLRETGEFGSAEQVLSGAVRLAETTGDRRVEWLARIERASLRDYTGTSNSLDELRRTGEEGMRVFEELADDEGLSQAASLLAELHWTRGHYAATEEMLEQALVHAQRAGDARGRAFLLQGIARAAFLGPMPVEAALRRCEAIGAQAGADRVLAAAVLPPIGGLHALRGDFQRARELYSTARTRFEEFGLWAALAALSLYSGPIELLAGAPDIAERELRSGCQALEDIGDRSRLSTAYAFLAQALYAQAQYEEADAAARQAAGAASPHDFYTQVVWRGTRARVLAGVGESGEAERLAREGVALASETDSPNLVGDALLSLADVLAKEGRRAEAVEHAVAALDRYRAKGNEISARHAENLALLDSDEDKS